MKGRSPKKLGLAIIGGGRVGLFRGEVATRRPAVEQIGPIELNPNRTAPVADKIRADFVTKLMLTNALDRSAKLKTPVALPLTPETLIEAQGHA